MTDAAFDAVQKVLIAMESGTPWTEDKALVYASGLRYIPDHLVIKAVTILAMSEDWRPPLSKIIAKVISLDNKQPALGEAMQLVRSAITAIDGGKQILPDAVARAVRDMGGLRAVGQLRERDFERSFNDFYKNAVAEHVEEVIFQIYEDEYVYRSESKTLPPKVAPAFLIAAGVEEKTGV